MHDYLYLLSAWQKYWILKKVLQKSTTKYYKSATCDYKSHSRFAVVRFCNHAFDFSPNCTPLSSIIPLLTYRVTKRYHIAEFCGSCHCNFKAVVEPHQLVMVFVSWRSLMSDLRCIFPSPLASNNGVLFFSFLSTNGMRSVTAQETRFIFGWV